MPGIRRLLITVGGIFALAASSGSADENGAPGTAAQTDAAKRGEAVFLSYGCTYCHESGGRSAGKGPQLMGTARDDAFIAFRVMNGKPGRMPSFSGSIDADQLDDLIAYIRSLKD
jgi:mono/diheme cytochrome c family protein